MQSYIDTYYIVAECLNHLLEVGANLDKQKLTLALHDTIQTLFYSGQISYLNSCLIEVIDTALGRFAELGVCKA